MIDLGLYAQLDDRTERRWENRVGRILVTLSGAFFSFGEWEWLGMTDEGFEIAVHEAAPFSRELRLRTQGFVERMAERARGGPIELASEALDAGSRILFRARYRGEPAPRAL